VEDNDPLMETPHARAILDEAQNIVDFPGWLKPYGWKHGGVTAVLMIQSFAILAIVIITTLLGTLTILGFQINGSPESVLFAAVMVLVISWAITHLYVRTLTSWLLIGIHISVMAIGFAVAVLCFRDSRIHWLRLRINPEQGRPRG